MTKAPRAGVVVFARQVERLAAFYEAILDLKVAERGEHYVVLESSAVQIVVHGTLRGRRLRDLAIGSAPIAHTPR